MSALSRYSDVSQTLILDKLTSTQTATAPSADSTKERARERQGEQKLNPFDRMPLENGRTQTLSAPKRSDQLLNVGAQNEHAQQPIAFNAVQLQSTRKLAHSGMPPHAMQAKTDPIGYSGVTVVQQGLCAYRMQLLLKLSPQSLAL